MTRTIIIYGLLSGANVIIASTAWAVFGASSGGLGMMVGYAIMLVAFSLVFVGVKKYRDEALGGIIGFGPALAVGLGIAGIASLVYVLGWEAYLWSTGYRFMDDYTAAVLAAKRAQGAGPTALAAVQQDMAAMRAIYARPLSRLGITLLEIAPVGVIVAVLSAAVLRNSRVLPARRR